MDRHFDISSRGDEENSISQVAATTAFVEVPLSSELGANVHPREQLGQ